MCPWLQQDSALDAFRKVVNVNGLHTDTYTEYDHTTDWHEYTSTAFTCAPFAPLTASEVATFVCEDLTSTLPKTVLVYIDGSSFDTAAAWAFNAIDVQFR